MFLFPDVCVAMCWWRGQVATLRSWWTWHNVTLSENISSRGKISKQFTQPPAFTQSQEITFAALSPISQNTLDRAASPQSQLVGVICQFSGSSSEPWGGDGASSSLGTVISLHSMIHQSQSELMSRMAHGTVQCRGWKQMTDLLGLADLGSDFLHLCIAAAQSLRLKLPVLCYLTSPQLGPAQTPGGCWFSLISAPWHCVMIAWREKWILMFVWEVNIAV